MFEHVGAGTGWGEDIPPGGLEHADCVFHNRTGFIMQSCIERRLSAAGLSPGEMNVQSQAAKNADDGLARLRVEGIDETGNEELHIVHNSIVIRFRYWNSKSGIMKVWYDSLL